MKYITGFFAFWYDFIVGDAWEVAVGVVTGLVALYLLLHSGASGLALYAAFLFPLWIMGLLGYSLWRVRKTG
ncbi:MAG: hypothetical protein ACJ78Q_01555 [Chloroflexia bacterium]